MANEQQEATLLLIFEELVKIREKICESSDAVAKVNVTDFFNEFGDILTTGKITENGSPVPEDAASGIALANDIYTSFVAALKTYADTGSELEWKDPSGPP